jgi:hypothetical protein
MFQSKNFFIRLGKCDYAMRWGFACGWGRRYLEMEQGIILRPWDHVFWIDIDCRVLEDWWRCLRRIPKIRIGGY